MSRTPYTDKILAQVGINADLLRPLAETHGIDTPIGQCAEHIQATIWDMQSAERTAQDAVANLAKQTKAQADALAGDGTRFDPEWLAVYTKRAVEANTKLTTATTELYTFKRLINLLVSQAEKARQEEAAADADPANLPAEEFERQCREDEALAAADTGH